MKYTRWIGWRRYRIEIKKDRVYGGSYWALYIWRGFSFIYSLYRNPSAAAAAAHANEILDDLAAARKVGKG